MTVQVEIVETRGSLRLIRCGSLGCAIVEERDGKLYSIDEHRETELPDTESGMAAIGDRSGWLKAQDARRRFDELVERGRHLARTIW